MVNEEGLQNDDQDEEREFEEGGQRHNVEKDDGQEKQEKDDDIAVDAQSLGHLGSLGSGFGTALEAAGRRPLSLRRPT